MMEESVNTQITPEKSEIGDGYETPNSTERLVIVKGAPKILSRYLSDRIPSCHDACKYGIQHSAEAKPWSAARKKFIARGRKVKASEEIVISIAGMNKSTSNLNLPPASKLGKPNCSVVIQDKLPNNGTVPSEKTLPSYEETDVSVDNGSNDINKEQPEQPSLPVQTSVVIKDQLPKDGTAPSEKTLSSYEETDVSIDHGPSDINKQPEQPPLPVQTSVVIKGQLPKDGTAPSEKTLSSYEETDVSIHHGPSDKKKEQPEQPSLPVQECSNSQASREVEKSKSPFRSGSKDTSESRSKQMRTSPIGGKRRPTSSPLSSKRYVKKSSSITSKIDKNLKGEANQKIQKNIEEVKPESSSSDNLQEKILHVDEPTPDEKSVEPTLVCDPTNQSLVSPSSLEDQSLKQDNQQTRKGGSPASSKKSFRQSGHGIRPTKCLAPSPRSSEIKGKRHLQKTSNIASSSLSPLSQSASSRKIFRHGDQGIRPTKSPASFPLASGIKVKRDTQNTIHNASSSLSPLPSSRRTFRHADNRIRLTKSLTPSSQSSGIKLKRRMQHTIHSASSSSSSPSPTESPASPSNSSLGKKSGATSKSNKTGNHYPGENVKVGYKIRPKRNAIRGAGNKVIPFRKLSFRRGKVIELQPQNNNVPRRLKFRPARLLSDTERENIDNRKWISRWKEADKGESNDVKTKSEKVLPKVQIVEKVKRRNFGRKVVDGSKIDGSASGSQQVVLRHQNSLGKKVTRRLYNNVIEETATKLAELRQSKVKALVGAFETVISLDSSRPEATPSS